jgi:hypothetical protein
MQYDRMLIYISFIGLSLGVSLATFLSWSETAFFSMHPLLLPIFFLLGVLLFLIVVRDNLPLSTGVKLAFVIAYSFLANLIHIALLYPVLTGDLAYHLAVERSWDKFGIHYFLLLPVEAHLQQIQGFINRLYIFQRGAAQYGLVVSLTKMLRVDLFWINALLIGLLWSFFVPIIAFKVSKTLKASDRTSLLTAILTTSLPILMLWSWKSAGMVFGLFFFFIATYFLLKSFSINANRKYVFLALLASVVSVLCHPMTGITSFSLVLLAFGIKDYYNPKRFSFSMALPNLALGFFMVVLSLPAMSVLLGLVYPTYSEFSLQKILSIDVYHLIFAEYANYTIVSALTYVSTAVLAIVGMTMFKAGEEEKEPRLFLIVAFIALVLQHRVFYYFIEKPLFGIHRLYALEPFVTIPFAAIAIDHFLRSQKSSPSKVGGCKSSSKQKSTFSVIFPSREALPTLLICISLSALLIQGHVSSFENDVHEPYSIVSPFSMKAVTLIHEEYLWNHKRYVVISDPITQHAGLALVGRYNPEELYLEQTTNTELFKEAMRQTSRQTLLKAAEYNGASLVYLTIFKYYANLYAPSADFDDIVNIYSNILEQVAILGDGERQTAVFRLTIPREPYTGIGPIVTILKDSQQFQLNTTYSYLYSDDIEYTLNLTGATSYNITDWPMCWSYGSISPLPSSTSIDANAWINFTGSPNVDYTVKWAANGLFPNVVWKDDSFLHGWSFIGSFTLSSHSFTSDGDIVKDSLNGKANEAANYQRDLPSLENCTHLLVRLKGETNSKYMIQIWEDLSEGWAGRAFLAGWLEPSTDYTTYIFPLPSDRTLTRFWLTALTTDGNPTTIHWDYVMIIQSEPE